ADLRSVSAKEAALRLEIGVGSGLLFPYRDLDGKPITYAQVKLDHPSGKMKYAKTRDAGNRLYFPPGFDKKTAKDTATPLSITEGEKKARKAHQEGLCIVALSGVWNWLEKDEQDRSKPIADLGLITWKGRQVFL